MTAGQLTSRVLIQQQSTKPADDFNGPGVQWVNLTTVWAEVKPLVATGRQFVQSQQIVGDATFQITIRFGPAVRPGDRLTDQHGRLYEVFSAEDADMRRAWLTILAKAVT